VGKLVRALGVLIALGSIAVGIWLQILVRVYVGSSSVDRALFALYAIAAVGVGVVVVAVGQMLMIREARSN